MPMKAIISLLSLLAGAHPLHIILSVHAADNASIDASGETTISTTDDETDADASCPPLLNGKLSSCDTFQIATLNSSPRRCIHIEAPPAPSKSDDDDSASSSEACADYPDWFDGTNGCAAYATPQHSEWCERFGGYSASSPHAARQACCACGGGTPTKPRLRAGEYATVTGYGPYDECELKIATVGGAPRFHYVLEVQKPCGPIRISFGSFEHALKQGATLSVATDDPNKIKREIRVELKKCRVGTKEQEFVLNSLGGSGDEDGGDEMMVITHALTGIDLGPAMPNSKSPFFRLQQVFQEDDLFEGSDEFYYMKLITELNEGRINFDGTPYGPTYSHMASGRFGEKEYSLVQLHNLYKHVGFDEQEFSMWRFQPVAKEESGDDEENNGASSTAAADEHAEWLVRMTQIIGIDYLTQLPPWHLLDVERDASKSNVKSRFRELSRSFHPDKLVNQPEKRELFERIFVLLQNAYQGLKSANEAEKEKFRVEAESGSQLFAHSQHVVELLPFHWSKLDDYDAPSEKEDAGDGDSSSSAGGRYILNAASHLNATLLGNTSPEEEESEPSVQIWVTFMYSARCSMSRTVAGVVDLAARHLEKHENVKVGAYGCGLYKEYPPKQNDPTGVKSDPICAQFQRTETPNVHVIVETIAGRKRDENGTLVAVPPDPELVRENAQFKHFYSAVATGNTTQFFPQNFINFAKAGKRIWQNTHLVHKMTMSDFSDPYFVGNASIVAFLDGTGMGETVNEVVDAITSSLPGVARRFVKDEVYVGIAHCGYGDEHTKENDIESQRHVDCSKLDVSWLPDIKMYGVNDTVGVSLLRGNFGDMRDVQIALESMGNVLRMMLGGTDNDLEDEFEELEDENNVEEGGGSCGMDQPPPTQPPDYDLDEIEGRMEETPLLDMDTDEETETEPTLEEGAPKKPKLASGGDRAQLGEGRENNASRNRISGFQKRENKRAGGGKLMGGGGGGGGGFIA